MMIQHRCTLRVATLESVTMLLTLASTLLLEQMMLTKTKTTIPCSEDSYYHGHAEWALVSVEV